jgi:ethanolamine utilization microcompartment shell protein EutS
MKINKVFVSIAIAATILLVIGFTAVGNVLSASPGDLLAGTKAKPIAAKFLPKRSPLVASFLVNPTKLSLFTKLAAQPGDRAAISSDINGLKRQLKKAWLIDYDKDLTPWLDAEITLAVTTTDIDRQAENGLQPGYLLALASKDSQAAKEFSEQFWQRQAIAGSDLVFEQYQGIPIIYATAASKRPGLSGTMLGKFVLFANNPKVIRNAINDLQVPDLALANDSAYSNSLKQFNQGRLGIAYVNLSQLGYLGKSTGLVDTDLSSLPGSSLVLNLGLTEAGIKADAILSLDPDQASSVSNATNEKAIENTAVALLPAGSATIAGHDLNQTWQGLKAALEPYPALASIVDNGIAQLNSSTGFDLPEKVFSWVKGDYAIAILPNPKRDLASSWVFIAQNTDPEAIDTAITELDQAARTKANFTVGEVAIGDQQLTVWTRLSAVGFNKNQNTAAVVTGQVAAVHGQTPEYAFIANSIEALDSILSNKLKPLTKATNYQTVTAIVPTSISGYAFIDDPTAIAPVIKQFPRLTALQLEPKSLWQPLLSHIQAIDITSSDDRKSAGQSRGQIFISLQ